MFRMIQSIKKHRNGEAGATAVEYGLLIALIAAVIVVAVLALGGAVKQVFTDTASCVSGQTSAACA